MHAGRVRRTNALGFRVLGFSCLVIASACAGTTPGGDNADAGPAPFIDAAPLPIDAAPVQIAPGEGSSLCIAAGEGQAGDVRSITCLGPVDLAAVPARQGGIRWQPGPITRVSP